MCSCLNFSNLAEKVKIQTSDDDICDTMCQLYELAEEVIVAKGGTLFKEEFSKLQSVVKNNKPVVLDLTANSIPEHKAWSRLMILALEAEVVENLLTEQKDNLVELAGSYDDGVDIFIMKNRDGLTPKQISQIYLAQTISFYYVHEESIELDLEPDSVLATLLEV